MAKYKNITNELSPFGLPERPAGRHRGVMDLSRGMAEALEFDWNAGLNEIKVRHYPPTDRSFHLAALP